MSNELKSAWELALEKMEGQGEAKIAELSDEQKKEIAEVRSRYKARIAEAEISAAGRVKTAVEGGRVDQLQALQQELVEERKKLEAQMEARVEEIRQGSGD